MQVPTNDFVINFSEEESAIYDIAKSFVLENSDFLQVRYLMESELGYDTKTWKKMVEMGWSALSIDEEYGGTALPFSNVISIIESLGNGLMSSPLIATILSAEALKFADSEIKSNYFQSIVKGAIGTLALRDKDSPWEIEKPKATAIRQGDKIKLSGIKTGVCFADSADFIIASVLFENKPCLVIIDKSELLNNSIRRQKVVDLTKRSFNVNLEGIEVPINSIIIKEDAVTAAYRNSVLLNACEMTGSCGAALELVIEYVKIRRQFGHPIGSFQAIKHPITDLYLDYELCRSLLYAAKSNWGTDQGWQFAIMLASKISDTFTYASDRGIQFHGGIGFTHECNANLFLKRAIWSRAQFGDGVHFRRELAKLVL